MAHRQAMAAERILSKLNVPVDTKLEYACTFSPGSAITVWAESDNGLIIGADSLVRITATRVNPGTTLCVDGQVSAPLKEGQALEIRRADCVARVIPRPGRRFFDTLRSKLQWGQSPHHT